MPVVRLLPLSADSTGIQAIQCVLASAPTYAKRVTGLPPGASDAEKLFAALPPGTGQEDKFVFEIDVDGRIKGCVDLLRGYPDRQTAMLGLLLLTEEAQGRGIGRQAYLETEKLVASWGGIRRIRIGIVATNACVLPFWTKMGFQDTGERKPHREDMVSSEILVYQKEITSSKRRHTLRVPLTSLTTAGATLSRHPRVEDAPELGRLFEAAYRGTIDDEGETPEQFRLEVQATMEDKYGPYLPQASFYTEEAGRIVSATLVTIWNRKPLLAFSVTHPDFQGLGHAGTLIRSSMGALFKLGYSELLLGVTEGNSPAESLYHRLGFTRLRPFPELRTGRTLLRLGQAEDVPLLLRYYSENRAHFGPTSPPEPEGFLTADYWLSRIEKGRDEFQSEQSLRFLILNPSEDPATREIIGTISFTMMSRGPFNACTLGYGIAAKYQGQGLMFEALRAALQYVFGELGFHRVMANHLPENERSAKLLKRLGFQTEGLAKNYLLIGGRWRDHVLNSLTRETQNQ